jgi:enamine deaminase RidA (YjgF/YER057c/UK114 family)
MKYNFMMKRKNISSGSRYEKPIGFSRAVRIGNTIAVSGTAPISEDGSVAYPGDLYNQTKRCIEIMLKAIRDAGGKPEDVIRTRIFLKDVSQWEQAAKAHGECFSEIRPACTFVEVKGLINPDWLIETEADCIVQNKNAI